MTPMRLFTGCFFAATLAVLAAPARAQTTDARKVATAKALFSQATAEMEVRRYDAACPKLEEVTRLVPEGVGAQFALAECYEGAGKLASAWSQFVLTEANAARADQTERAAQAHQKAAALKPRLITLSIVIPGRVRALTGLTVSRDKTPISAVELGVPVPVDPGVHEVTVTAPSFKPFHRELSETTEGTHLVVEVPNLESVAAPLAPVDVARAEETPPPPPTHGSGRSLGRTLGLSAMGAGVLGLGVGAVLGGIAISDYGQSNNAHDPSYCTPSEVCGARGTSLRNSAYGLAAGSTAAFVAGSVLLAGGATIYFVSPRKRERREAHLELCPTGLSVAGVW